MNLPDFIMDLPVWAQAIAAAVCGLAGWYSNQYMNGKQSDDSESQ